MKRNTKQLTLYTTRGSLIAAMYVLLTLLSSVMGLSSGIIQFRFSEALCILPIFMPEAIPGLFIGCLISNLLANGVFWDVIFGSLATLIGALGAYYLRSLPENLKWLATLPTVLANMIIVPFVLIFAYGAPDSYFFIALTVGIGEIVCAGFGGSGLYYLMKKTFSQYLK
ncbi:MAG: QueT transporter family protein [Ruminococcaceae bacterium]|nr:QueT transporter family protein [Oscillospiraceae bacterium]